MKKSKEQKTQFLANNTDYQLNQLNRFAGRNALGHEFNWISSDIAPINIWDDGTFTYFKFGANTDIPAIYYVDENGRKSI